jgi:predicted nuclease of predicted toxin-antitoxin system
VRFLIDECLHTSLVEIANDAGYEAHHVVHRGWAGFEDHELRPIILREAFVFVTNNGRDFLELLGKVELHPGLVVIVPNEKPPVQRDMFRVALQTAISMPSTVNKVIEIYTSEDVRVCDLPKLN